MVGARPPPVAWARCPFVASVMALAEVGWLSERAAHQRSLRGGACIGPAYTSRGAQRLFYPRDRRDTNDHGLRCVVEISRPETRRVHHHPTAPQHHGRIPPLQLQIVPPSTMVQRGV